MSVAWPKTSIPNNSSPKIPNANWTGIINLTLFLTKSWTLSLFSETEFFSFSGESLKIKVTIGIDRKAPVTQEAIIYLNVPNNLSKSESSSTISNNKHSTD